jgi:hypothetical protein
MVDGRTAMPETSLREGDEMHEVDELWAPHDVAR